MATYLDDNMTSAHRCAHINVRSSDPAVGEHSVCYGNSPTVFLCANEDSVHDTELTALSLYQFGKTEPIAGHAPKTPASGRPSPPELMIDGRLATPGRVKHDNR